MADVEIMLTLEGDRDRAAGRSRPPARPGSVLRRRKLVDRLAAVTIAAIAFTAIAAVVLIFVFVGKEALPVFLSPDVHHEVTFGMMVLPQVWYPGTQASFSWQPVSTVPKFSLAPLIIGTAKVTLVSLWFAVPLAVLAAIFSSEFAGRRTREVLKPAIELLAGIPSVVLGFFALIVLATIFQDAFGFSHRLNAVVAGVALGMAIIPVVFTITEDALMAVPWSYREAALALGASRARTAWSVILPAASPGIFAAIVLGVGRAVGETMIVLMASGNAATLDWTFGHSVRTVPATIAAEMGEVVVGGAHWSVLFLLGVLLFLATLAFNTAGGWYVARLRRKLGGIVA